MRGEKAKNEKKHSIFTACFLCIIMLLQFYCDLTFLSLLYSFFISRIESVSLLKLFTLWHWQRKNIETTQKTELLFLMVASNPLSLHNFVTYKIHTCVYVCLVNDITRHRCLFIQSIFLLFYTCLFIKLL